VVYNILHGKCVPNIPSVVVAGDVATDTHHRPRTHEFIPFIPESDCDGVIQSRFTTYRHYRIVFDTVGRPLDEFRSSHEFICAMKAALEGEIPVFLVVSLCNPTLIIAHQGAVNAGVLHRDISVWNIMIADE
jgi:hypothetical protein